MSEYKIERWSSMTSTGPAILRLILKREGFAVHHWNDAPEAVYATHKHDEDQSHWIVSGILELSIERVGTFQLGPGDRDFMPANTYHSARVIGEEPVSYLIGIKRK